MNVEGVDAIDVFKDKVTQDIVGLKADHSQLSSTIKTIEKEIADLKFSDQLQNREISDLKVTLTEIKEGIVWIQRKITGAIITAIITAIVAGVIGIAITTIFKGN